MIQTNTHKPNWLEGSTLARYVLNQVFKFNLEQCGSTQKPAKALCRKCIHQVICKLNVGFFLFCALCNTVFGVYVSEKKNVWWLWYGSSSCLCCTLLKGNCLEGHQNLKGTYCLWGYQNFTIHQFNYAFPLPFQRKRDAFEKVLMLHKPSFDIQITKILIILNNSVQYDVSWEGMEHRVGAEEQKTELIRVLVGFSFHLCWIHLSYLAITYFMITLKNGVHFCDVCWEDMEHRDVGPKN